jgi:xylan 1,4-beta-xylosidase
LLVNAVGGRSVDVTHERVDATHSNAYEAWKRMGSPQPPTKSQYKDLERAGRLQRLEPSRKVKVQDGRVRLAFTLPRQAVSLVRVTW